MTPPQSLLWDRWDEVDHLLAGAMERPPAEREEYVRRAAGADASLCDLVLRLLERTEEDEEIRPSEEALLAAFSGRDAEDASQDLPSGDLVGRYRIVGRVGRGGMATVYEAERADGAYEQRVALKVLRRGLDTEDIVRRFLTERQILSSLSHPNIARLLDGGSTATGRPFLVMELVRGERITKWTDRNAIDVTARLRLFLAVADAVHAAHQQLVVHRDIKPSNILVDEDGCVKLLDFGIAKLLAPDATDTDVGSRALTPDYASPEQLEGGVVTTATDVWQLGLLLRELLTGLAPAAGNRPTVDVTSRPSRSVLMTVETASDPVQRAQARGTTPARLAKTLRGDLDIIIGKATRRAPAERYASAGELSADVQRYLQGQPIVAHPESTIYRVRKYAGRHPLFLPLTAATFLAIVAFVVIVSVQNRRIEHQRDAAELASRQATATRAFLVEILRSPDPTTNAPDRDLTVAEALQRGRVRIAQELDSEPAVKADLLEAMGRTFTGLGRYETGDTLLRDAVRIERVLYGPRDARLADVLNALGTNLRRQQDYRAADTVLQEALHVRLQAGPVPDSVMAPMLMELATVQRDLGDVDSAVVLAGRGVTVQRAAGDTLGEKYVDALSNLAYVLRAARQMDSAEVLYRDAIRREERRPALSAYGLSTIYNNLGYLLRLRGDYAGAEAAYREAFRLARTALGETHPATSMVGSNLASVLELEGKLDAAEALGRDLVTSAELEWPQGHWRVGAAYMSLGRFLLRHDRAGDATIPLRAGVRSYEKTLGAQHAWTLAAAADLATELLLSGHRVDGGALFDRALAALRAQASGLGDAARHDLERTAKILEQSGESNRAAGLRRLLGGE